MKYLLDSNACIGWLRQSQPKLVARIKQEQPADLVICSVVVGELIYGAERRGCLQGQQSYAGPAITPTIRLRTVRRFRR